MPHLLLAASFFYSVIIGFWGTTDSPHLLSWVPEPMLCQQHWWLVPSLFLIIFSFWCFFPKSLLLTFHFGVSLKSWLLVLLPSRSLIFFRLSFWLPFLLSFFPSELILSCQVESLSNYLRYRPLAHELLASKLSGSFLHHWVVDRDVPVLIPCVSWHSFWAVLILSLLCCMSWGFRALGSP